jgi:hypothetical protein
VASILAAISSLARTDLSLFHSFKYLVALHRDLKLEILDSPEGLYHGGDALRMIKERIHEGVFSDMTITPVAMLVIREVGSPTHAKDP